MRKKFPIAALMMSAVMLFAACAQQAPPPPAQPAPVTDPATPADAEDLLESLRGTTVTFYAWGGNPFANTWLDNIVATSFYDIYGINMHRVPIDPGDSVTKLLGERMAGVEVGDMDIIWINGENFYAALNAGLLYGPITHRIENFARYLDPEDLENLYDFGTYIGGMSVPYGRAQLVFAYDTAVLDRPPASARELLELARQNPGRLTYVAPPDFTGSAFVRNIIYEIVGFEALFNAPNDEQAIYEVIRPALDFMVELKPYLWQQGQTYPTTYAVLHDMFTDGLVLKTKNYTPLFVAQRILAGEFPETAQTFVFDNGNIGNTHFLMIPYNAPNKEGALRLINHIISPEIQITKYDARNWGDFPVFDVGRLSAEQRAKLDAIDNGIGILTAAELQDRRIPEVQAYKIPIIDRLWIEHVLMQ